MGVEIGAALIAGGAALGSAAMTAHAAKGNRPEPTKTVANPNFDAIMARYLNIMDKYMSEHGIAVPTTPIKPLYPAPGSTPEAPPAEAAPPSNAASLLAGGARPAPAMLSRGAPTGAKVAEIQAPAPAPSAGGSLVPAVISGAAQLGGAAIANSGRGGGSGRQPTVDNPYYQPVQDRYMAIFDDFLTRKGYGAPPMPAVASAAPAPEAPQAPEAPPVVTANADIIQPIRQPQKIVGAPISEDEFNDASLAAKLGARRLGLADAPALPTTRDFHERDQAAKQEELNRLYQYVYGQRTAGAKPIGV